MPGGKLEDLACSHYHTHRIFSGLDNNRHSVFSVSQELTRGRKDKHVDAQIQASRLAHDNVRDDRLSCWTVVQKFILSPLSCLIAQKKECAF